MTGDADPDDYVQINGRRYLCRVTPRRLTLPAAIRASGLPVARMKDVWYDTSPSVQPGPWVAGYSGTLPACLDESHAAAAGTTPAVAERIRQTIRDNEVAITAWEARHKLQVALVGAEQRKLRAIDGLVAAICAEDFDVTLPERMMREVRNADLEVRAAQEALGPDQRLRRPPGTGR